MRILIRTSKLAIWSRRLASFAVPLAVVAIFMHRGGMIGSDMFHVIGGLALLSALLGFLLAIASFVRLWMSGDRGWGFAVSGLLFSLLVLAPAAYGAYAYWRYPMTTDVYTDLADPPMLVSDLPRRPMTTDLARQIAATFPNVASRTYPLGPQQVFELALTLAGQRGWEIEARQAPLGALGEGQLNAMVVTLLGWRDEVSVRITGVAEGSTVAMRSTSLVGFHDLGGNGQRIEEFLLALDTQVTVIMRDAPVNGLPDDPVADAEGEEDA